MRSLAVIALIVWGSAVWAAPVTTRSGDHASFTRLVFGIAPGTTWKVGRVGDGYGLRLAEGQTFDLSRAFDRIDRDRVANLNPDENLLRISLGCDCHAETMLFQDDMLIVDIKDGPPPTGSPSELPLDPQTEGPPPFPTGTDNTVLLGPDLMPAPLEMVASVDARVASAQAALLESLAEAASQGVLDMSIEPVTDTQSEAAPVLVTDPAESPGQNLSDVTVQSPQITPIADLSPAVPPTAPGLGLRVQTAAERDTKTPPQPVLSSAGVACIGDNALRFDDWSTGDDFASQFAARTAALTDENGNLLDQAIVDLARTYLYFGFGREAQAVLDLDEARSVERDTLEALAAIMDGEAQQRQTLTGQLGCIGSVALWAALARGSLSGSGDVERISIVAAQKALPEPVRAHIGTLLAQLFLDAGEPGTAEEILSVSERDFAPVDPAMTQIEVTQEVEGPAIALQQLEANLEASPGMSSQALVKLFNLSVETGKPIENDLFDLADALRFEGRGTAEEAELTVATVDAMIAMGLYQDAISFVLESSDVVTPTMKEDLTTKAIVALTQNLQDGPFIEAVFGDLPIRSSSTAENSVAARLIDLGFTAEAKELVSGPADAAQMAERRLIRAKLAVAEGRMTEAIDILNGINDPRAPEIIAEAKGQTSPTQTNTEFTATLAWRTGAWDVLETGDDPALREAAMAMMEPGPQTAPVDSLAQRQLLIEEAEATRELANSLLERFPISPEGATQPTP